ncbi:hypothetical protein [Arthrobacter sp. H20]|uniref:hypothetical protein n=1 Tax=Arthrobacter sp. H20 TaxID=1267981 RepID=UPI00047BC3AC|nr:hypothetical protein [Arthrobacter sp. H20]
MASDGDPEALGDRLALTGDVSLPAMVTLNSSQTLDVLKELDRLRSWVDGQEAKAVTHLYDLTAEAHPWPKDVRLARTLTESEIGAALYVPERTAGLLLDTSLSSFLCR